MDTSNIYNDPIIVFRRKGTVGDPYKQMEESLTVNRNYVILTEIPNRFYRVRAKGTYHEIEDGELTQNTYKVDYVNGAVYFHSSMNGKNITVDYMGEGVLLFPDARIYVSNNKERWTLRDKLDDLDRLDFEQKVRVDNLIASSPQPSEVVDLRVDRNGKVYLVAKDRLDAEQKKIEDAYKDLNGKQYNSLKDRLDTEQKEIEDAYLTSDKEQLFNSLNKRLEYDYQDLKNFTTTELSKLRSFVENEIETINNFVNDQIEKIHTRIRVKVNVVDYGAIGDGVKDDTKAIQDALDFCHSKGGGEVYVPHGSFKLTKVLVIRSNTNLVSEKSTKFLRYHNDTMLANGKSTDNFSGYNGNSNITISGGIWDCRGTQIGSGSNCLSFGHAKNILVSNVTIKDVKEGHAVEIGGVDGITVKDSHMLGFIDPGDRDFSEAIGIDLCQPAYPSIIDEDDEPTFREFGRHDYTITKNLTVDTISVGKSGTTGTTSWGRGVGGHSINIGTAFENIKVVNSNFKDTIGVAIRLIGTNGGTIIGNTIENCGGGILINPPITFKVKDTIDIYGKVTGKSQDHYDFIVNGNVVLKTKNNEHGISINGQTTGRLSEVVVNGNVVKNSSLNGIYLKMVKNATVTSNVVNNSSQNGISITATDLVTCTGNSVDNSGYAGIYFGEGVFKDETGGAVENGMITNNTVRNSGTHNIVVTNTSSGVSLNNNIVVNSKENNIYIADNSKKINLGSNTITSDGISNYGINITDSVSDVQKQSQMYNGSFKIQREADYSSSDIKKNAATNELLLTRNDYIATKLKDEVTGEVKVANIGNILWSKGHVGHVLGTILTLPEDYRPSFNNFLLVPTIGTTGYAKLQVSTDGEVKILGYVVNNTESLTGCYMNFNIQLL